MTIALILLVSTAFTMGWVVKDMSPIFKEVFNSEVSRKFGEVHRN